MDSIKPTDKMSAVPRSEYPRPRLKRLGHPWVNLNGKWEFEFDFGKSRKERRFFEKERFSNEITVPFVPESELSGIGYTDFLESIWYRRAFDISSPIERENERLLLHFGAVNNRAEVWLNGKRLGEHRGGYTPFTLDVTEYVKIGENVLTVHAESDVRNPLQPSGKQSPTYANQGCFYTRCTGIWQTVWLEYVPATFIKDVKIIPDIYNEKADVTVIFDGYENLSEICAEVSFEGEAVCRKTVKISGKHAVFSVDIPSPKLWDIGKGNLYDMTLTAGRDAVSTYFGMRSVCVCGNKFLLNGKSVFQRLVLDQGYYEKGIYTAESESDFVRDISLSMAQGFNGARMHMKVFEPGYIFHADKMGYLLWGEYPNWGLDVAMTGAFDAIAPSWREAVERDFSSPAVIGWCPLNETWCNSDEFTSNLYRLTKSLDFSRPVIDVSGYMHSPLHDIYDVHDYEQNPAEFKSHYEPLESDVGEAFINFPDKETRDRRAPYFVSEFGGTFFDINDINDIKDGESENEKDGRDLASAWGYGEKPRTREEFYNRLEGLVDALLSNSKICGFCYTQLTDVMQEMNGLFTFDRRAKFDSARLRAIFGKKAAIED